MERSKNLEKRCHNRSRNFTFLGRLPIFEAFGGALNRAGALTRAGALIKTYENLDLRCPAHTRTLFIVYDNYRTSNILKELLS